MDQRVPRLDRGGTIASSNFAGVGGSFLCVFLFVPINPTNWWRLVQTLVRPEFREDQFAEQNLVAPGVKCHVTWHVMEMQRAVGICKRRKRFGLIATETCDSGDFVFVVLSGTVVAPIEPCELPLFEIP